MRHIGLMRRDIAHFRIGAARLTYRVVLVRAWKILRKIVQSPDYSSAVVSLYLGGRFNEHLLPRDSVHAYYSKKDFF